jgi:superfamily I DNA and/or RNA helicase
VADACVKVFDKYEDVACGTIHAFQGKETDIVFIILGSDPNFDGARAWAAEKPNMLNVALTRAKQYVYVIGNRQLWAKQPYFNYLAEQLPVKYTEKVSPRYGK